MARDCQVIWSPSYGAPCGRALIIDYYSFPSKSLPYEVDQYLTRPAICIGTDAFHTLEGLATIFVDACAATGWTVGLKALFGAIVPSRYFELDRRVAAVMIEVSRDVCMGEAIGAPNQSFAHASLRIHNVIRRAL